MFFFLLTEAKLTCRYTYWYLRKFLALGCASHFLTYLVTLTLYLTYLTGKYRTMGHTSGVGLHTLT